MEKYSNPLLHQLSIGALILFGILSVSFVLSVLLKRNPIIRFVYCYIVTTMLIIAVFHIYISTTIAYIIKPMIKVPSIFVTIVFILIFCIMVAVDHMFDSIKNHYKKKRTLVN